MTEEPEASQDELLDQRAVLAEFGRIALKADNLQDILQEACRLVGRGLDAELVKIIELQSDGCTLLVCAGIGWNDGIVGHLKILAEPRSSETEAINTGEPFVSDDIESEQRVTIPSFILQHGVRSLVNVPIFGSGTNPPYGILQVDSRRPRAFTQSDIDFLRGYANLLASAIERLTLLPKLEAALEDKKRILQELQDRMESDHQVTSRLRALADATSEVMYHMNADWSEMCYLSGRGFVSDTDEPNRRWVEDYIPLEDQSRLTAAIQTAIQAKDTFELEHRVLTKAGGIGWTHSRAVPVLDINGDIAEWFGMAGDISARKSAEADLRAARDRAHEAQNAAEVANQAKTKFLAAASHDLRQPMQSLLLFLEVLKPHVAVTGQEALKHLERGLDALRDLLDSLLDISRLDAGVVQPVIADFAIEDLIGPIGAAYSSVATAKGIAFQVSGCSAIVRSDGTLLGRMVRNLAENALRYTEAGRIAIECHEVVGRLRIEVHDTGIGIPMDHLTRIWGEFHQVGNPERDRNRGLGLGLAIVQRLSTLLEHPVDVRSVAGQGSIFSIEVPLGAALSAEPPERAAEIAGSGRFALLVDDDAIVLLGLKTTFEAWGYKVLAAGSTDRALAGLQERGQRPDIVIADYRLREGRNGTEAILRVREVYGSDVPGIILTGETGGEAQRDAVANGLHVIHKPVTARQLGEALDHLLMG
jgi:signal transduction histidine kinase/CheY-like chemotaxis protein